MYPGYEHGPNNTRALATIDPMPNLASQTASANDPGGAKRPVYLDYDATGPVDPRVAKEVMRYMCDEFGNAGSRTHTYGQVAKERVNLARRQIADVAAAKPEEIIFTSGATESDNIAILGLAPWGEAHNKRHIVSTLIEHKAVLEPLAALQRRGFEVDLLPPTTGGWVTPEAVAEAVRPDTLLVSVMVVNNETGVIQPISEIADALTDSDAYLHIDAAQAFGKILDPLRVRRVDLIAASGHKIGAPKGIGALITRRRGYDRPPLSPLMYGGGQERGLRPGTLPVPLIAGLGTAAAIALEEHARWQESCQRIRDSLLQALVPLGAQPNGDLERSVPNTLNLTIPGVDSEAAIVALKDIVAISNGSACTSQSYEPSHVLKAAGLGPERVAGALRFSWGADTVQVPAAAIAHRLRALMRRTS